ncbi:MAG: CapA family protein [Clostridiales bacterium]|nr:CapA family protein [Clostridiales bacterium]
MKRMLALLLALLLPVAALAETQIITITCTGDTTLGSNKRVSDKPYAYQRYIEQYGYDYPFAGIRSLTENDDITLVNLEGVLYTPKEMSPSRYAFCAPEDYVNILTAGSVEVVNLANNHTLDYQQAGYQATVAALDAAGVKYCGETEFGRDLCWFDFDNDVRIGFIGVVPSYYSKNQEKVQKDFQKLRDAGCDVIIASMHAGKEDNPTHSDMTTRYRKICMANGAHIVVGNHPHVPQGLWVEKGVTTLHSLGNFSFGGNTGVDEYLYCDVSLVAQIQLHFEDGVYIGHQVTLYPIRITGAEAGTGMNKGRVNNYQPVLLSGEEAQAVMKRVQKDTEFRLNPYVDGQGAVQDFVPWSGK